VHQQNGLFPWLTARENIALGLRKEKNEENKKRELDDLLALIHLNSFADSYPHQLSGGMKQRVELARALAGHSDILLLDEPFSALDYLTRLRLRRELQSMLEGHPRTVVFVTHDVEEAAQLADRIVVLSPRPARVTCELSLDLPRPRDPMSPEVIDATRSILRAMGIEEESSV
jgi:ABC-type nitrate/sulfonate/bicarbonate transport system ATPase subunit